ncbi:hypothetical protein SAMD00023353_0600970 [Rosellinia necatrix]|uniref:Uncharacterized protein n=1 Tax=Rosellinia necatrix TaxID=77044 RepID=A0A1S8A5V5_ROSNE|nr:hypothetical protein SAMD00023353_0600970 [Rosellinia necatrix]
MRRDGGIRLDWRRRCGLLDRMLDRQMLGRQMLDQMFTGALRWLGCNAEPPKDTLDGREDEYAVCLAWVS